MEITLEQLIKAGYQVKAAPGDAWRNYDEGNPVPGYFDFDWLSSRHPDLYHRFALTSVGLMKELEGIVDLTGLSVVEVGAGTGRAAIEAGRKAKQVTAVDIFESVLPFGNEMVRQAGLRNVHYIRGDCNHLPLPDDTFDAFICSWAIVSYAEAYRVLKPGGYVVQLGPAPGSLCGELTATLANQFPHLITEIAPAEQYEASCPDADTVIQDAVWEGIPVTPPVLLHDFTYIADYGDAAEAAAIHGRLYGPLAKRYLVERQQSRLAWRLRVGIGQVKKGASCPISGFHVE